jgi:poly(3-hydroxybutyrate) depolymerase
MASLGRHALRWLQLLVLCGCAAANKSAPPPADAAAPGLAADGGGAVSPDAVSPVAEGGQDAPAAGPSPDAPPTAVADAPAAPADLAGAADGPPPAPADTGGAPAASAGCGKVGAPTGERELTVPIAGRPRKYLVSVPAAYDPNKPLPVVFFFHGRGGSIATAKGAMGLTGAPGAAGGAIFVIPEGLEYPQYGPGAGWDQSCNGVDTAFFDTMLAALESSHCVDPRAVFVAGFSWGADMTDALACCRGDKIRAVSNASGDEIDWNSTCPSKKVPAYRLTYADSDQFYTQAQFQASIDFYRKAQGCGAGADAVAPAPCVRHRDCAAPVISCRYVGLGHAVPGGWGEATWSFFSSLR